MRVGEVYSSKGGPYDKSPFVYLVTEATEELVTLVLLDGAGDPWVAEGEVGSWTWEMLDGFQWRRVL